MMSTEREGIGFMSKTTTTKRYVSRCIIETRLLTGPLQDQLAEYTCPSPVYFEEGRYGDGDQGDGAGDMFDYFADLEYLSDGGYFDDRDPDTRFNKRRKVVLNARQVVKKRKGRSLAPTSNGSDTNMPVIWMSHQDRHSASHNTGPLLKPGGSKTFALLEDWRTKFQGHKGLAEFPEGDFRMEDNPLTDDDEEVENAKGEVTGEGFDLRDLQKVAEMIGSENMEALQKILETQGLDPAAVQEVLQDMIEGKEREFDEEDPAEDDAEEDDEDMSQENEGAFIMAAPAPPARGGSRGGRRVPLDPIQSPRPPAAGHPNRRAKRKDREEDDDDDPTDEILKSSAPTKKPKNAPFPTKPAPPTPPTSSSSTSESKSPSRRTRSGRVRK